MSWVRCTHDLALRVVFKSMDRSSSYGAMTNQPLLIISQDEPQSSIRKSTNNITKQLNDVLATVRKVPKQEDQYKRFRHIATKDYVF